MALITSFANENSLILGNREALTRQFNFGSWTEIRIGLLYRVVGNTNNTSSYVGETISILGITDRILFGLKSSGNYMPGISGSNFIGAGTKTTSTVRSSDGAAGTEYVTAVTYVNLFPLAISGSSAMYQPMDGYSSTTGFAYPDSPYTTSDYNGFYGLKFVLQNAGAANQLINVSYKRSKNSLASGSAQLQSNLLSDSSWATYDGQFAYNAPWTPATPLPDSFFVYFPFYNNRVRMSVIQAIKIR